MRGIWMIGLGAALALWACSDDETASGDTGGDVAGDATGDTSDTTPDVAGDTDGDTAPDPAVRGEYLVHHVADCVGCHSPLDQTGQPVEGLLLAGNPAFVDIDPTSDEAGLIPSKNLTNGAEGIADWTDEEIMNAFLNGVDRDGNALSPIMPYFAFHNMAAEDAQAIVAYLRTVPANDQEIPARQVPVESAALPIPLSAIPQTTLAESDPDYAASQTGRYYAGLVGICVECHTPEVQADVPRDLTLVLAGGRSFPAAAFGLPVPPFPEAIFSRNITPDATGIAGWTAEQVRTVLLQGTDIEGDGICPPMPVGPTGAFGGMTEEDALAIGVYLTTIPGIENADIPQCTPPSQ